MTKAEPVDDEVIERLIAESEHQATEASRIDDPGMEQYYHCVANALRYQGEEIANLKHDLERHMTSLCQAETYINEMEAK